MIRNKVVTRNDTVTQSISMAEKVNPAYRGVCKSTLRDGDMANGLRLVTLVYRPEYADTATLERGFAAVREHLTIDGLAPVAFIGRSIRGGAFLRVLCSGGTSFRDVRRAWCSVATGAIAVNRVRDASVLAMLSDCEQLSGYASSVS